MTYPPPPEPATWRCSRRPRRFPTCVRIIKKSQFAVENLFENAGAKDALFPLALQLQAQICDAGSSEAKFMRGKNRTDGFMVRRECKRSMEEEGDVALKKRGLRWIQMKLGGESRTVAADRR